LKLYKRLTAAIILSIIIIILMLWIANPSEFASELRKVKINIILIVILLYFGNVFTKAYRWYLLVNSTGANAPFKKTLPYFVIALAFNNVTPGKIGGEPIRAYLLKKEAEVSVGQGIASIITEKIMDLVIVTTMALIGAIYILPRLSFYDSLLLIIILIVVLIGTISVMIILTNQSVFKKVVNMLINFGLKRSNRSFVNKWAKALVGFVEKFKMGMSIISRSRGKAGACAGLTVVIWTNEAIRVYLIFLAMEDVAGVSLGAVFIATSIANILGLVMPLGSGNIFGVSTVFIAVGMDATMASMGGFLHAATSIWISIPLGVMTMLIMGFRLSKISK